MIFDQRLSVEPFSSVEPLSDYIKCLIDVNTNTPDQLTPDLLRQLSELDDNVCQRASFDIVPIDTAAVHVLLQPRPLSEYVIRAAGRLHDTSESDDATDSARQREELQRESFSAIVSLGGHAAVSGAFRPEDIREAYGEFILGLDGIKGDIRGLMGRGLREIRSQLQSYYYMDRRTARNSYPITRRTARTNIRSAWHVASVPYGQPIWIPQA